MRLEKTLSFFSLIFLTILSLTHPSTGTEQNFFDLEVTGYESFKPRTITWNKDTELKGARAKITLVHKTGEREGREKSPTQHLIFLSSLENILYTIIFMACADQVFSGENVSDDVKNWPLIRDSLRDTIVQIHNKRAAKARRRITSALRKKYTDFTVYGFDTPDHMWIAVRNPEDGIALRVLKFSDIAATDLFMAHNLSKLKGLKGYEPFINQLYDPTFTPNYKYLFLWTKIFKPDLKSPRNLLMSKTQGGKTKRRLVRLQSKGNPLGKLVGAFWTEIRGKGKTSSDTRFVFDPENRAKEVKVFPKSKKHAPFVVPSLVNLGLDIAIREGLITKGNMDRTIGFKKEDPRRSFDKRITTEAFSDNYRPEVLIYDQD